MTELFHLNVIRYIDWMNFTDNLIGTLIRTKQSSFILDIMQNVYVIRNCVRDTWSI